MTLDTRSNTPWNIVLRKFGMSQNQLAFELNCDKSKISRARHYGRGLIDQHTQVRLLRLAKQKDVNLTKDDLIPDV
jgi:hypothetical protein